MREPYHQLYAHLVWSTWDRLPLLTAPRQEVVYRCIQAECVRLGVDVLAIGGVADHVHLLVRYAPTLNISELMKQVKGVSSHAITHGLKDDEFFKWQSGYGAFSLSKEEAPRIRAYILNQEQHHRDKTLHPDYEPE